MQDILAKFIQYIKDRKSVDLEDLAVEFGLKVKVSSICTGCPANSTMFYRLPE